MLFLLIAIAATLIPTDAYAWGGGIHLQLGAQVLANPGLLPGDMATLLTLHPKDFLYGCLAPDITLGKKYTHSLLHCHRWGIGRTLLKEAENDHQKACAYGYLCHLAADTIAHNYYVPYKTIRSFPALTMKHTYWEMRFEAFVEKDIWKLARIVCRADRRANDVLLRNVLTTTIFSFGTNRKIFNSIMVLSRMERMQKLVQAFSSKSRYQLTESDRDEYMQLAREAMVDFLNNPGDSKFLKVDPTGEKALAAADSLRKKLRLRYKNGFISKSQAFEQVEAMRSTLRNSLHKPELLKKLHV
ncbi:MAG: zinc dependent phospholipase C family protein [Desulfuromonadaceae bacterium]|nr:zinc dependent phospholipase C family protein [Desulfuromonadaceae bacterium]MDD5105516.1 zinc dependent phospholipase C family protein [Desulfuromonadaceae bacterium]